MKGFKWEKLHTTMSIVHFRDALFN